MTYGTTPSVLLPFLPRLFWLVVITGGLAACRTEEVRGVLVAKYTDGSGRFIKRIAISTIEGPVLSMALVTKTKRCELIGPVPAGALSGLNDCKDVSGTASLRCEGTQEVQTRWQMTSCHSGYGRSIPGTEPAFLFGFSGNSYTAQNQLELAEGSTLDASVNDCQALSELSSLGECKLPDIEPPLKSHELLNETKLP